MIGKTYEELSVGQFDTFSKTITETDITMFGAISGDFNPAHFDQEYAKKTRFKKRIAHGMVATSLVSGVLGMKLPGPGTIYLDQSLMFIAPVYIGDTITAKVEVLAKLPKNRIKIRTYCFNQSNEIVIDGEAHILPPLAKFK
jgi:3-hydroxybutyryl-CoA dehydratase